MDVWLGKSQGGMSHEVMHLTQAAFLSVDAFHVHVCLGMVVPNEGYFVDLVYTMSSDMSHTLAKRREHVPSQG